MGRPRLKLDTGEEEQAGLYFLEPECDFFSSGCTLLDCVLGGGWVENRVVNVVGDKSTGKTLQAIEAAANYHAKYPKATVHYIEAEAAFDQGYARTIGLPETGVVFPEDMYTVEDVFRYLDALLESGKRSLVIIDSLDALSDSAEQKREISDGTYGATKAKQLSQMFRRLNSRLSGKHITVLVVSQVRDKMDVTFGKKQQRSGGKALDFYASQVLWLTHIKRLSKQRAGVKRPYGVVVQAQCEKNKVSMPFRSCVFPIHFAFGIEDVIAGVEWLLEVKQHKRCFSSIEKAKRFLKGLDKLDNDEYEEEREAVSEAVREAWAEIEGAFLPARRKYR